MFLISYYYHFKNIFLSVLQNNYFKIYFVLVNLFRPTGYHGDYGESGSKGLKGIAGYKGNSIKIFHFYSSYKDLKLKF
jgi:hypothetical protein